MDVDQGIKRKLLNSLRSLFRFLGRFPAFLLSWVSSGTVPFSVSSVHNSKGSSAPSGPSLGTSSSKCGNLRDSPKKRGRRSARIKSSLRSIWDRAADAAASSFRPDQFSEKHRRHPNAIKGGEVSAPNIDDKASEEGSATERHSETGRELLSSKVLQGIQVGPKEISIAGSRLPPGMEFFRNAQTVRLRSAHGYLVAEDDKETVALRRDEKTAARGDNYFSDRARRARWSVEFVLNSDSVLRLKSCHGKYLAASDKPSRVGMTGCQVLQSLPPLLDSVWEPMKEGKHVKLRTRYGSFLCTGCDYASWSDAVIHDLPHHTTFLWDVKVVVRKEASATYIDNKASEEGSASNIDDKASASNIEDKASEKGSASKRRHETGEGSSVTKSPPGVSALIREGDGVTYRSHFWQLKKLLCDDSGRKDVLVKGGSGTTALVREQKARCLIVVDNLDDGRTWKKFEEVLRTLKTCRVIFIARPKMGLPDSQIYQCGREFETYQLGDLSSVPRAHHMKNFLKDGSHSPSKRLCELIVRKCKRLRTAIAFVLHKKKDLWRFPSFGIKDEWEARIPSVDLEWEATNPSIDLRLELHVIQQVLGVILGEACGPEPCPSPQVWKILLNDVRLCCLLYLSIFPENSRISCNRVSRLWAAEKLLPVTRAERFFNYLLESKCIHPEEKKSDGELSTFRVDKRVQKIIASLSDIHNLVTITSQGKAKGLERVRYRSVEGPIRALHEEKEFQLSSTFVLDDSSNEDKTATSEPLETFETPPFPSELKHSKVLDLTDAPFQVVPDALRELTNARSLQPMFMKIVRNQKSGEWELFMNGEFLAKIAI
ncbi:hypothetical protein NL676_009716 [Syzygium grande]|nr:hypothetical protein NL676_009716 [Syzygium grande]